jgi:hypothetical protein
MTLVLKLPHRPSVGQQRVNRRIDPRRDAAQHPLHLHRIGARVHDPLLRAAQFRRRHHLHRLGDLLRVLDRADSSPQVD